MTVMVEHEGGSYTVEDLEGMPDDGRRYELIDGQLHVSPAPGYRHQKIALKLGALLDAHCPDELTVLTAPFTVRVSSKTEVQPDVLVGRHVDFTDKLLPVAPLLAVEVLSPSTNIRDLTIKKIAYERMGVVSYWVIDPQEPVLAVFELDAEGCYRQVAEVKADDAFDATLPFPVRIVPAELLGRLWENGAG
ncbi:Uma2 family endonuclease [Saccharothrix sp. 6-C]|uniref:Uma2 family endonuclease n=1 Tax=Saccharothrix sp. 6-C TaxID=2781735 RepID=UPI001916F5AC|nr:Uma2 family endonuclease [Saccharothrix sp. 6-C]QQQ77693.1 Uma2 family endonuclease [Saccharothrix sp. 6-C]